MSKRNGDRARFQKERRKKMLRRERTITVRESIRVNRESRNTAPKVDIKPVTGRTE